MITIAAASAIIGATAMKNAATAAGAFFGIKTSGSFCNCFHNEGAKELIKSPLRSLSDEL